MGGFGRCSVAKVRALIRVATADNEAYPLDIGRHGTAAHVEKFARLYRQASQANETERADARHRERGLTFWHEDDGTVVERRREPRPIAATGPYQVRERRSLRPGLSFRELTGRLRPLADELVERRCGVADH